MSGIGISLTVEGLGPALSKLGRLADLDEQTVLDNVGNIGANQTRQRIEVEKTAPDGAPWEANRDGNPILMRSGEHLRDSIAHEVSGSLVRWGSSWQYAHVHQNGATIVPNGANRLVFMSGGARRFAKKVTIPARPFVGMSEKNRTDMERVVTDWFGRLVP